MHEGGQDQDRRHRKEHDPTFVQKRRVLTRPPDQDPYHGQPYDSRTVNQEAASTVDGVGEKLTARPHHGHCGADEEAEGAGVGSFVDSRRVYTWLIDQGHSEGRESRASQGQAGQGVAPGDVTQPEPEQPGPDQIELLLYSQGPQVIQRRWWPEAGEVGCLAKNVPPVAHVANGSEHVSPEAREQGPIQQRNPRHYNREHQEKGG